MSKMKRSIVKTFGKKSLSAQDTADKVNVLRELLESGNLPTLTPLLPLLFNLDGKPYSLVDHFPFAPVYRTQMPKRSVFMTARQMAKSSNVTTSAILRCASIPFFRTLVITPLFEQVRRLSANYFRTYIDNSPVRSLLVDPKNEKSVLQRSFKNQSMLIFTFAFLDADRVRGISAAQLLVDEIQDMDRTHLPIMLETISHSEWEMAQYNGTPKSDDNILAGLYKESSMAEWFTRCMACNHWNIASVEYDLIKMIGPYHPDISEHRPGTICARCSRPINPRTGRWIHRKPELRFDFAGFHMPQLIIPHHYAKPEKWRTLLAKQQGAGNTSPAVFYNEVLGTPVGQGVKLISEQNLMDAGRLPIVNDPRRPELLAALAGNYGSRVLAVDWGGGGEKGISYTAIAAMGFRNDGVIDVVYGNRLLMAHDHQLEALEIRKIAALWRADFIVHDYTGAGAVRETVLVQKGFPIDRLMPIAYVRSASANIINHVPPNEAHGRHHYRADKTRSLLFTCTAVRSGLINFFKYDYVSDEDRGLLRDFTALIEDKSKTRLGSDIYRIDSANDMSDDFAQAVNIGAVALWHHNQAWPDFSGIAQARLTSDQMEAATGVEHGWQSLSELTAAGYFDPYED
jgi:hypothetical protein